MNEELATTNDELRARGGELDETRHFLESVLSSLPLGVVVLDVGLRVLSWSSGASQLWGLRREEAESQQFFMLDLGLPTSTLRDSVHDCLQDGVRRVVDVEARNRLGRSFTCQVTVSALDGQSGGLVIAMAERLGRLPEAASEGA